MKPGRKLTALVVILLAGIAVAGLIAATAGVPRQPLKIPVYRYVVVNTYPHDRFAFTEGLAWEDGTLYEGTGIEGNSSIRTVDLDTGQVTAVRNLPPEYFGEGIAVFGDRVAQLTEDSHIGFVYNRTTLAPEGNFTYPTEGWGLAWDGTDLVMSDGTDSLYFLDPVTFRQVRTISVQAQGVPVDSLNELEFVDGDIYANIWPSDQVARIDPQTGNVTGWIDLSGLLPPQEKSLIGWAAIDRFRGQTGIPFAEEACPNGIAYDPAGDRLFVTGKLWPELFEIRIVPA